MQAYGDRCTLLDETGWSIAPNGWEAEVGATYSVSVTGTATPIAYGVQIIDCE